MEIADDFPMPYGGKIPACERDANLELHSNLWARNLEGQGWNVNLRGSELGGAWRIVAGRLRESVVRWPSAPLYGIHRRHDYHYRLPRINYHTLRVLRRYTGEDCYSPVKRIYILHNGLNETEYQTLYFRLADALVDEESACIIRPFPGHLTRFPLPARFSEQPLDRYLSDAADLYRQFLRFMIETQWLLSAIVPMRSYRAVAGLDLLCEGNREWPGRERAHELTQAILKEWRAMYESSGKSGRNAGSHVRAQAIEASVSELRDVLGWSSGAARTIDIPAKRRSPAVDLESPPSREALNPAIHVVGYSLGGYVAQSVFFTWPFAISSCTTICSGGALRSLEPTKFAHPEEWQTLMHALKYEIESAMLENRMDRTRDRIAGIQTDHFRYYHRIFNEVLVQDHPGSYASRVSEFQSRLLFVAGGRDPIVSIPSILEAAPEEGLNLIAVANLPHFIFKATEWRLFSQPHVVGGLKVFSQQAETFWSEAVREYWWSQNREEPIRIDGIKKEQMRRQVLEFQQALDGLIDNIGKDGWLFVFRNQLPVVFMGPAMLQRDGAALYHADENIAAYVVILKNRRNLLESRHHRVAIVVPRQLKSWFLEESPILSENIETAGGGKLPSRRQLEDIWRYFESTWSRRGSVREFYPSPSEMRDATGLVRLLRQEEALEGIESPIVNALPDAWISLSRRALDEIGSTGSRDDIERRLEEFATELYREELDVRSGRTKVTPNFDRLSNLVGLGDIKVVEISSAEFNQRYIGQVVEESLRIRSILVHAAVALMHAQPVRRGLLTSGSDVLLSAIRQARNWLERSGT